MTATASDPHGYALHYSWRSTDGTVQDTDSPSAVWTLQPGAGLHFLYVLVSNEHGGYASRRIAVNTDAIGGSVPAAEPVPLSAPPGPAPSSTTHIFRAYGHVGVPGNPASHLAVAQGELSVRMTDAATGASYPAAPDAIRSGYDGSVLFPAAPFADFTLQCARSPSGTFSPCLLSGTGAPVNFSVFDGGPFPPFALSYYDPSISLSQLLNSGGTTAPVTLVGRVRLADGSACGTHSEFFGVSSMAMITVASSAGVTLAGPSPVNAYGEFTTSVTGNGITVTVACEKAPPASIPGLILIAGQTMQLPLVTIAAAAPTVSNMTATLDGSTSIEGKSFFAFLPPPTALPSDSVPRDDAFLSFKGSDSRLGACMYYKAVGAVRDCGGKGELVGPVSFADWQRAVRMGSDAAPGAIERAATYINLWDLNLTRRHHSISYGPSQTAAYVCNHLGPDFAATQAQADVDRKIEDAAAGKNLVACVAMDYSVSNGVNGERPFIRFLIFGPSGQLLPSVNLDGRSEKFVPGTCTVCHGGDHHAGPYPADGSGRADLGAHFLPYDTANFAFHSGAGGRRDLTEAAQEEEIYQLNQNVLSTSPTPAEASLISGWYANGVCAQLSGMPHRDDSQIQLRDRVRAGCDRNRRRTALGGDRQIVRDRA